MDTLEKEKEILIQLVQYHREKAQEYFDQYTALYKSQIGDFMSESSAAHSQLEKEHPDFNFTQVVKNLLEMRRLSEADAQLALRYISIQIKYHSSLVEVPSEDNYSEGQLQYFMSLKNKIENHIALSLKGDGE